MSKSLSLPSSSSVGLVIVGFCFGCHLGLFDLDYFTGVVVGILAWLASWVLIVYRVRVFIHLEAELIGDRLR